MGEIISIENDKFKMKEGIRKLRIALFVGNIIAVIPVFLIALFNVPAADDFSMAFEVHEAFLESGSVFAAIFKGIYMGYWYYMNWTGYFFSDALTALAPSVFHESLYFLGTFGILIMFSFGFWFFMRQLLTKTLRLGNDITGCITSITYAILLHTLPVNARCESFFWYSGAINYMFMFSLSLLWLGLMIKLATDVDTKLYAKLLISLLGFLLGGANYMTALSMAIISACILFIAVYYSVFDGADADRKFNMSRYKLTAICLKLSSVRKLVMPSIFMIVGFICSVVAPGNSVRSKETFFGPVKTVLISIYYTLERMFGEWLTFPVMFMLALLVPFLWKAAGKIRKFYKFEHPVLFGAFAILLASANITPPLYATGNIIAGRIQGIYYMQGMLLLILLVGYLCGWVRVHVKVSSFKDFQGVYVFVTLIFVVGSCFAIKADPHVYTGTSAVYDLATGKAGTYKAEFKERLKVLKDDSVKDVKLKPYSVKPELLYFSDITDDASDWLNNAVAEYYHKDSVVLDKKN
ncbi:DUF6056 family protein [Butyrivibrio sp. AE3006]|uniref:DUF6056 family protein n=1 Tax=Butyrivibrio sp. AE3006 TaxID=1280673 RepID=UPI000415DE29|nr:DUF6056 family protein [Butyrivibrio sp. AE3006]